ncbi:MAG: helix-turn-helix transcriptional regulator [Clostridia bacterium]|nr:helix-turn-helix transcriptional regulator [Clostridia bacterium]
MEQAKEELKVEKRTLEEMLKNLREEKHWTYMQVVEELGKIGLMVDEKKVRKWEIGLEYPEINEIYKLSEMYFVASENFIMAKNNSYQEGLASVHATLIKWVCYFTGISLKIGYIGFYIIITLALIGALMFFVSSMNRVVEMGKENI